MANRACRSALTFLLLTSSSIMVAAGACAQGAPTTTNGDWPLLHGRRARQRSIRRSTQINAANFSKLEVAWRFKTDNLGTRPEYKLEGTPLADQRRCCTPPAAPAVGGRARRRRPAKLIWVYSLREGQRAGVRAAPALGPRRLLTGPTARETNGSLYVTHRLSPGRAERARPASRSRASASSGIVDLKDGVGHRHRQQIDLETGEIGLHSTPTVVQAT